jgi:hypothetical protein
MMINFFDRCQEFKLTFENNTLKIMLLTFAVQEGRASK